MRVGEHDLDLDRGLLTRNGVPVHLRARHSGCCAISQVTLVG